MTNGKGRTQRRIMKKAVPFLIAALFFVDLAWSAELTPIRAIRTPMPEQADCRVSAFRNYEDAVSAIACVFAREFNVSVHGIYFLLHPNQRAFESSLVSASKFDAAYARQTAAWAVALSTTERVLVNEAALSRFLWPERVRVLAHELAHTVQYRLAGGRRSTSDQWLREGLAEWMASHVVQTLKLSTLPRRITLALERVRKSGLHDSLPSLHRMVTFYDFAELRSTLGTPATYDQTFIAADLLIQRYGLQTVLQYFRLFAQSDDRLGNFRASFGMDLSSFEEEFGLYLQKILH